MGLKRVIIPLLLTLLIVGMAAKLWAGPLINIDVNTILASQDSKFIDPSLSPSIRELQSVFRYSSYRLLAQNRMNLGMGKTGKAVLPGNRILKVTPMRINKGRVVLRLEIFKKRQQIFQTVVQLRNRSNIIVGGPKHKGGVLLFNIFNSF